MPLRLAVVGTGRMGRLFGSLAPTIPDTEVAWVVSRRRPHAEELAAALACDATDRFEDVLEDDAVDAVVLATPTPTHASLAEAAAGAGKAVFLEKPPAATLDEGKRLVRAIERSGVPAQIGFQRRYDDGYLAAKARLDAGELGTPETFRAVARDPWPPPLDYLRTSGGLIADMGIHDLDLARFLMGEVSEVRAIGASCVPELAREGIVDTSVGLLRFESGAVGTIEHGLRAGHGYEIRTEVVASKGRVVVERDRDPDLTTFDREGAHVTRPRHFDSRFGQAFRAELAAFVANVRDGRPVSPSPRDAWLSLRLALAAQHALESGAAVDVRTFGGEP